MRSPGPAAAYVSLAALPAVHLHPVICSARLAGTTNLCMRFILSLPQRCRGFQVISVPLQPSPSGLGPGTSAGRCCLEATAELEGLDPSNLNRQAGVYSHSLLPSGRVPGMTVHTNQ